MKFKTLLSIAVSLLFVFTGCTSTVMPPVKKFAIETKDDCCKKEFKRSKLSLMVLEPTTSKMLNSTSIHYSKKKFAMQSYALNKWGDYPTKMIQKSIVLALDNASVFDNTISGKIDAKSDLILQGELFDFYQLFESNKSYTLFKIKFYLTNVHNKKTVSKLFYYKMESKNGDAYGAVESLNSSVTLMLGDLLDWVVQNTDN